MVQGKTLEFGHRGWLLDESFLFYDRQSDSLWVQATGECVRGKYRGERLRALPATHTTWGEWKSLNPNTLVLAKPPERIDEYRVDGYEEYYRRRGVEFGLAVFVPAGEKLYPLDELAKRTVLRDEIAGEPVLVVFHPPTGTAVAWDPVWQGADRDWQLEELTEQNVWLREPATGTVWSGLSGEARESGIASSPLRQLRSTQFVVANWRLHFPESVVYGAH